MILHYINYLYLGSPSGYGDQTIPLYAYGTGSQFGAYSLNFTLEITNLASKDNGNYVGIYDIQA